MPTSAHSTAPPAVEFVTRPEPKADPGLLVSDPKTVPGYSKAVKLFEQAAARFRAGEHIKAAALFREAIKLTPGMVAAHNNLGVALRLAGNGEEAVASFQQALEIDPDYLTCHMNLGLTLRDLGKLKEAIAAFRHAVAADPNSAESEYHLGSLYLQIERPDVAANHLRRATRLAPEFAEAHTGLGIAFTQLNRVEEARTAYARAVELKPGDARALFNLATCRADDIPVEETEAACRAFIAERPELPEAHNGLGVALQRQNRHHEALASFRRAAELKPDFAQATTNEAMALLTMGRFEEGWPKYEHRRYMPMLRRIERALPIWEGENIADKSILIHSEQGLGDTVQFLRYLPLVAERAKWVMLEIPRALVRMAASLPVDNITITPNDQPPPRADAHSPLLSLPRIFGTRADSIPGRVPYLMPRRPLAERWARLIGADDRLRVGLVWAGNKEHRGDRRRSISLDHVAPLLAIGGIAWCSLQVGPRAADVALLPAGTITDLSAKLTDFAETAGAILNLDLVIAVDTAVVHLAGALGKPVWIMLPFSPDWRWLLDRDDSPWYPTARLYRQRAPGDWDEVVARVAADLRARAAARVSNAASESPARR